MANQAARTQQFASVEEAQAEQQRLAEDKVFVWPHLVVIEMIGALTYILLFGLLSVFINAPLRNLANPEVTPNPSKAPWYFLGLQELLLHMHPALAGVIVPAAVLVGLACIPYIDTRRKGTGIYFYSPKGVPIAVFSAVYTTVWNVGLIVLDEFLPAGDGHGIAPLLQLMGAPAWVAQVVVPSAIMLFIPWSLAMIVKARWRADTREVMIALFTFFVASFVVLTVVGSAFRGHSMKLVWPWEIGVPEEALQ